MLKRNGERSARAKPLVKADHLTRGELDAYSEAIEAIEGLLDDPVIFTIPGGPESDDIIEIRNVPADRWRICSPLLKFRSSQIFLCDRKIRGVKEFAVIERFNAVSPYAQANGEAEVLLVGNDPVLLVQDYASRAEPTLQFMASNLVSKAHRIVWARYASTSPSRVISVISAQCAEAASMGNGVGEAAEPSGQVQPPRQASAQNRITHVPV